MPGQRRSLANPDAGRQHPAAGSGEVVALAARRELSVARQVRARELVAGTPPDGIAAQICWLGCLVAARHAGLPAVREYREALLTG